MPKVAKDIVEKRPGEIVTACRKLYKTMTFQEIMLMYGKEASNRKQ